MFNFPLWDVLGIIAIAFLAISFYGRRNATWSSLIFGFIIGLITAGIYILKDGTEFNWTLVRKICTIATFVGAFIDIINFIVTPRRRRI